MMMVQNMPGGKQQLPRVLIFFLSQKMRKLYQSSKGMKNWQCNRLLYSQSFVHGVDVNMPDFVPVPNANHISAAGYC